MKELSPELKAAFMGAIVEMANLLNGTSDKCPHCAQKATPLSQVGRSIVGACGCRICQGRLKNKVSR